jgi:hypothetical protein
VIGSVKTCTTRLEIPKRKAKNPYEKLKITSEITVEHWPNPPNPSSEHHRYCSEFLPLGVPPPLWIFNKGVLPIGHGFFPDVQILISEIFHNPQFWRYPEVAFDGSRLQPQ